MRGSHHVLLSYFEISQVSRYKTSITLLFLLFPSMSHRRPRSDIDWRCSRAKIRRNSETAKCFRKFVRKRHGNSSRASDSSDSDFSRSDVVAINVAVAITQVDVLPSDRTITPRRLLIEHTCISIALTIVDCDVKIAHSL